MQTKAFAARDSRLGIFMPPFFMQHTGQALRAWEQSCNDPKSSMNQYPDDFQLFEVGAFDEDNGVLVPFEHPKQIATAKEYIKVDKLRNVTQ